MKCRKCPSLADIASETAGRAKTQLILGAKTALRARRAPSPPKRYKRPLTGIDGSPALMLRLCRSKRNDSPWFFDDLR